MKTLPLILICDDDPLFLQSVKHALKGKCDCRSAYNGDEALALVKKQHFDLLLLDIQMRSPDEGLRFIPELRQADSDISIVMASGVTDFRVVKEALQLGANDYLAKGASPDEIIHSVLRLVEKRELARKAEQAGFEATQTQRQNVLIGDSEAMKGIRRTIDRLKKSDANVLILGETGTGKEVVARQLRGTAPDGTLLPFVAMDASTIQNSTAESLLFGHEKGAFTGAERAQKGFFEEADGGILYFDEIGNMPLEIQPKLLRAIQEKEVVRLGSTRPLELQFRVVCATNMDLEAMSKEGRFKFDLFQRLSVLPLFLPSLRERKEDIPALLAHFVRKHSAGAAERIFTSSAIEALQAYPWLGNVRELSNTVAYLLAMTDSAEIDIADIPPRIREANRIAASSRNADAIKKHEGLSLYQRVAQYEKMIIAEELEKHAGNVSKLALALGMDRSHLYTKLKEHGLKETKRAESLS